MKDMCNKALVATDNSAFSTPMVSAIDSNRLMDNIFNGKNTPYLVGGILGITYLTFKLIEGVMEHKYSVNIEKGETSVSFAPQNK